MGASLNGCIEFYRGVVQGQKVSHAPKGATMRFGTDLLAQDLPRQALYKLALPVMTRLVTDTATGIVSYKSVNRASSPAQKAKQLPPKVR